MATSNIWTCLVGLGREPEEPWQGRLEEERQDKILRGDGGISESLFKESIEFRHILMHV